MKELVYEPEQDILLKRPNDVTLFVYTLINSGYAKHHTSLRCGSVPKGVSFVRQYSGRFGVGVIIVEFHRRGCVEATYYKGGIVLKFREFITAFTFIILLALLLCIVYARATWEEKPVPTPEVAKETVKPAQSEAPEPSEEPIYYEMYFTEDDVAEVAKMLWGEARGCTRDNQIKCAWVVCNRVDDERFPDTIQGVLEQPSQFHGYDPSYPVTSDLYDVAFDVLTRWSYEKQGIPVRRELAKSYLWFTGNGQENIFREVY